MDAAAEPAPKHQPGEAQFSRVFTGGGSLDSANLRHLVQGDRPAILEDSQNLEATVVGQPLKNSLLTIVRSFGCLHIISKFAKKLIVINDILRLSDGVILRKLGLAVPVV
jgi:hypothetical protein